MRPPKADTHQACRSLLQKAARRGHVDLVRRLVEHLVEVGDRQWVNARAAVVLFEECWPMAVGLEAPGGLPIAMQMLERTARHVKNKEAAGLGALAHEAASGDAADLLGDELVRLVAVGADAKDAFFDARLAEAADKAQREVVDVARRFHGRVGWPWDQAFLRAAALLAVRQGVPEAPLAPEPLELPLWVALDRHTPEGKAAYRVVAKRAGIPVDQVGWCAFYFESARTNALDRPTHWWRREAEWRLGSVGLTAKAGQALWAELRPFVVSALEPALREFESHTAPFRDGGIDVAEETVEALSLFSRGEHNAHNRKPGSGTY